MSLLAQDLMPFKADFPAYLDEYTRQMIDLIKKKSHHDHRRHVFIEFLRKAFGIDPFEVEIEKKVKVAKINGCIDALFKSTIFEFKTDYVNERPVALVELKKYFAAQSDPSDYLAIVTDGLLFEVFQWDHGAITPVGQFRLSIDTQPLDAFRFFDQFVFSSKPVTPSSSDIISTFGLYSAVFNVCRLHLEAMFEAVITEKAVQIKLKEWNILLAKVYGSELGDLSLFIRHNYLAVFSRLLITRALFGVEQKNLNDYRGLLTGEYFLKRNMPNVSEPDFFSWAIDTCEEEDFLAFLIKLERYLSIYDLSHIDEDILKGLYQELVDPESRHTLGEYYTPDWLAELTLSTVGYDKGRLLDPACGSGSFIFRAIKRKRESGLAGHLLLDDVLTNIIGIDVHPLAVMMTKANVLLALSKEIKDYEKEIYLQVYLADTLLMAEDVDANCIEIPVSENEKFYIPLETLQRHANLDVLIDKVSEYAHIASKNEKSISAFKGLQKTILSEASSLERNYWKLNFSLLVKLIKEKRNSIWPFILKNAYRPAFLRMDRVDYVVGNPPWLSYRYIKDSAYRKRVKQLTFELGLLEKGDVKLFTQMDTSTIFFRYCIREFLKRDGIIAMVMPKTTILPAKQHILFQQQGVCSILDFSAVQPLFNVRAVVITSKKTEILTKNIPITFYKGSLPTKNAKWATAKHLLTSTADCYSFLDTNIRSPYYYDLFFQGATLVPRSFWFVQPMSNETVRLL